MTQRWKRCLLAVVLTLTAFGPLGGCSTNPATGKRQLALLSPKDEIRLGEESEPKFLKQSGGELPSKPIVEYVRHIGQKLAGVSERSGLPWKFHVLNSPVVNAFSLPGGKVFISRGLLSKLNNEAQLAGVLGHEIGHVTAEHVNQRMSRQMVVQGLATGLSTAGQATDKQYLSVLGVGTQLGGTFYLLKYSRSQETQADRLGVRYMSKLGYNPAAQVQVMHVLENASSGGQQLAIFSTHPNPGQRIKDLKALIGKKYPRYDNGKYAFYPKRFQTQVLDRLKNLPPAPQPKQPRQPKGQTQGRG